MSLIEDFHQRGELNARKAHEILASFAPMRSSLYPRFPSLPDYFAITIISIMAFLPFYLPFSLITIRMNNAQSKYLLYAYTKYIYY